MIQGTAEQDLHHRLLAIYREHRRGLYALAMSVTRRPESAEDAIHEAFSRLCRVGLKTDRDDRSYVFAAVRNAAVDQIRRGDRARPAAEGLFDRLHQDTTETRPEQAMMERERDHQLQSALDELPDDARQCVVMKIYGGLTFDEISQALGEPLSTVASRYRRALEKLRTSMEALV